MRLTALSPHVTQLTRFGLVNCYLVRETDGFTLVDTGLPGTAAQILHAARVIAGPLAEQGAPSAKIQRILLTHGHGDHVGSVDKLVELLGPVELAITRRDARLLAKDKSLDPGEPQTPIKGSVPGTKARATHFVEDGELYGSLRVLFTPGHTPGHAAFFCEPDGTLLAGDELASVSELRVCSDPMWLFPLPGIATWDKPTALASAERILQQPWSAQITRYGCGHGDVREGGRELSEQAVRHARK